MSGNKWIAVGATMAAIGVMIGAFGAHGLETWVAENIEDPAEQVKRLANWQTGARYQMYHAIGLVMLGIAHPRLSPKLANSSGFLMILGTVVFSGCLYVLVLTGMKVLGAVVPLGGLALILSWGLFAISAMKGSNVVTGSSVAMDTSVTPKVDER